MAAAAPDERLAQFDGAPGVTDATRRCNSPEALLADGVVDAVQVSTRFDVAGRWIVAALERGLPVMAEKPLASSLEALAAVHAAAGRAGTPVCAMHGQRGTPLIAAARAAVRGGATGTPLVAHNQKSYRWGARPRLLPPAQHLPRRRALDRRPRLRLAAVDSGRPLRAGRAAWRASPGRTTPPAPARPPTCCA